MRNGAKELQRMAPVQLCCLQEIGVSPEVAGTRRRHKGPVVLCVVRVSTKCCHSIRSTAGCTGSARGRSRNADASAGMV